MKLYELSSALETILERVFENDGEISVEDAQILPVLEHELKTKTESLLNYIDYLKALKELAKQKEQEYKKQKERLGKKIEWLNNYIYDIVGKIGPIETDLFILKQRKPAKVVKVINERNIPEDFKEIIEVVKVDKKGLKEYLKENGNIDGVVELIDSEKKSLSIRRK